MVDFQVSKIDYLRKKLKLAPRRWDSTVRWTELLCPFPRYSFSSDSSENLPMKSKYWLRNDSTSTTKHLSLRCRT